MDLDWLRNPGRVHRQRARLDRSGPGRHDLAPRRNSACRPGARGGRRPTRRSPVACPLRPKAIRDRTLPVNATPISAWDKAVGDEVDLAICVEAAMVARLATSVPRGCYEVHASCLNMLAIMRQAKAT